MLEGIFYYFYFSLFKEKLIIYKEKAKILFNVIVKIK